MDAMILLAQTCLTAYLAAWLTLAVRDNILHPETNAAFAGAVLRMERLEAQYPEDFKGVAHRRIESRRLRRWIFGFTVTCEALVCLLLWTAAAMMAGALFGLADPVTARTAALAGTLGFTSIWAGFLILGNHFVYWMCHEWAQASHFKLLLWGLGTMIFLILG